MISFTCGEGELTALLCAWSNLQISYLQKELTSEKRRKKTMHIVQTNKRKQQKEMCYTQWMWFHLFNLTLAFSVTNLLRTNLCANASNVATLRWIGINRNVTYCMWSKRDSEWRRMFNYSYFDTDWYKNGLVTTRRPTKSPWPQSI